MNGDLRRRTEVCTASTTHAAALIHRLIPSLADRLGLVVANLIMVYGGVDGFPAVGVGGCWLLFPPEEPPLLPPVLLLVEPLLPGLELVSVPVESSEDCVPDSVPAVPSDAMLSTSC